MDELDRLNFQRFENSRCLYCHRFTFDGNTHTDCLSNTYITKCLSLYHYNKNAYKIISTIKKEGNKLPNYIKILILELSILIRQELFLDNSILIPVPIHQFTLLKNNTNHAFTISQQLQNILNLPINTELLLKDKTHLSQKIISAQDREINTSNIFHSQKGINITNETIIIVDDVSISGHTLISCAKAIHDNYPNSTILAVTIFR